MRRVRAAVTVVLAALAVVLAGSALAAPGVRAARARVASSPAGVVTVPRAERHLAGFQAHDVGLDPYGRHSLDRGPAAGAPPSKALVFKDLAGSSVASGSARPFGAFPGVGSEIASFRTAFSRTFVAQGGGYVARVYSQPVNYKALDGSMQPIDETLVPGGGGFVNRGDSVHTSLPRSASAAVRISGPAGDVSFQLLGAGSSALPTVSGAGAAYRDALPGVSLRYSVQPGMLKEAIVLAKRECAGGAAVCAEPLGRPFPGARSGRESADL